MVGFLSAGTTVSSMQNAFPGGFVSNPHLQRSGGYAQGYAQ